MTIIAANRAPVRYRAASTKRRKSAGSSSSAVSPSTASRRGALVWAAGLASVMKTPRTLGDDGACGRAYLNHLICGVQRCMAVCDHYDRAFFLAAAGQGQQVPHEVVGSVGDRKSTRLNSSHVAISYAVFCLK